MIFRTPYTFELKESDCETIDSVSETIPDQALTVQQLYERHLMGTLGNVGRNDSYYELPDGSDDFDSYDPISDPSFDLTDAQAELRALSARKGALDATPLNGGGVRSKESEERQAEQSGAGIDDGSHNA